MYTGDNKSPFSCVCDPTLPALKLVCPQKSPDAGENGFLFSKVRSLIDAAKQGDDNADNEDADR